MRGLYSKCGVTSMNDYMTERSKIIKAFRALRGISQDRLSQITKIERSKLSRIENGYIQPSPEEQKKIAQSLKCEPYQLFL